MFCLFVVVVFVIPTKIHSYEQLASKIHGCLIRLQCVLHRVLVEYNDWWIEVHQKQLLSKID